MGRGGQIRLVLQVDGMVGVHHQGPGFGGFVVSIAVLLTAGVVQLDPRPVLVDHLNHAQCGGQGQVGWKVLCVWCFCVCVCVHVSVCTESE